MTTSNTKSKIIGVLEALCEVFVIKETIQMINRNEKNYVIIRDNKKINMAHWSNKIKENDCCLIGYGTGGQTVIKLMNYMDNDAVGYIIGGEDCFALTCNKQNNLIHIMRRRDIIPMKDLIKISTFGRILALERGSWSDDSKVILFHDNYKVLSPDMACSVVLSSLIKAGIKLLNEELEHHPLCYLQDAYAYL